MKITFTYYGTSALALEEAASQDGFDKSSSDEEDAWSNGLSMWHSSWGAGTPSGNLSGPPPDHMDMAADWSSYLIPAQDKTRQASELATAGTTVPSDMSEGVDGKLAEWSRETASAEDFHSSPAATESKVSEKTNSDDVIRESTAEWEEGPSVSEKVQAKQPDIPCIQCTSAEKSQLSGKPSSPEIDSHAILANKLKHNKSDEIRWLLQNHKFSLLPESLIKLELDRKSVENIASSLQRFSFKHTARNKPKAAKAPSPVTDVNRYTFADMLEEDDEDDTGGSGARRPLKAAEKLQQSLKSKALAHQGTRPLLLPDVKGRQAVLFTTEQNQPKSVSDKLSDSSKEPSLLANTENGDTSKKPEEDDFNVTKLNLSYSNERMECRKKESEMGKERALSENTEKVTSHPSNLLPTKPKIIRGVSLSRSKMTTKHRGKKVFDVGKLNMQYSISRLKKKEPSWAKNEKLYKLMYGTKKKVEEEEPKDPPPDEAALASIAEQIMRKEKYRLLKEANNYQPNSDTAIDKGKMEELLGEKIPNYFKSEMPSDFHYRCYKVTGDFLVRREQVTTNREFHTYTTFTLNRIVNCKY